MTTLETASVGKQAPSAPRATSAHLMLADRWDHVLARWGYRRNDHRVRPGLYAVGGPTPDSPVFVTANYTLSFDALRSMLADIDSYILVLDTHGVNVWCAAGKGTFGTEELVRRIEAAQLHRIVSHRRLVLPQLGAPGVAANEVKRRSGFKVEYGPVRASDLPAYLEAHHATPDMRRVRFHLRDRLKLIPVEFVHILVPMVVAAALVALIVGPLAAAATVAALLAGAVLFPILLPWLPTHDFSSKGFVLGWLVVLPFALATSLVRSAGWQSGTLGLAMMLALPPVTAFLALNFTGSTPFTSKSGVKREMATYIPVMAWSFGIGLIVTLIATVARGLT